MDRHATKISPTSPSLMGLPPELRLPIYEEVFRVASWEQHQAKCLKSRPLREKHWAQWCLICPERQEGESYLYPPAAIDSVTHSHLTYDRPEFKKYWKLKEDLQDYFIEDLENYLNEDLSNRAAILRVCKQIYSEAVDVLYFHTPFKIEIATRKRPSVALDPELISTLFAKSCTRPSFTPFFPRIKSLYMHADFDLLEEADKLMDAVADLVRSIDDRDCGLTAKVLWTCISTADRRPGKGCNYHGGEAILATKSLCCRVRLTHWQDTSSYEHCVRVREVLERKFNSLALPRLENA